MTPDPDERDLRAAEYVLGTLPAAERAAMDLESAVDPTTRSAVRAWERRLAPLALIAPDVAPGPQVWEAIRRALPGLRPAVPANDNRVQALTRSLRRWRLAAGSAAALAAGLAVFVAAGARGPGPADARYVAVVSSGGAAPALIVSIDTASGTARVRPVAAEAPAGGSLELWYVGAGQAPKSLGLIGRDAQRLALPAGADSLASGTFAVSAEPAGGSPTGQPTGPVVYSGKLIRE